MYLPLAVVHVVHGARQYADLDRNLSDPHMVWMKGGFIAFAVLVVFALAFFNGSFNRLGRNKAKNNRPARSRTNELGSGDMARKVDIQRWLSRKNKLDTLLPVKLLKGSDGIAIRQGNLVMPLEERNRHVLFIAKTGSGKTTRAILPVLYNDCMCPDRSTIVIDSKPEMWDKLVGMTRKFNPQKKILLFNPLDIERSLSWNILSKIQTDTDAKLIANTIISATDNPAAKADSPFFRNNALSLLNSIMVGLLTDPNERLSMPRVHQLVNGGMENLCKWLETHPQAIRNSKTFVDLARSGSQNADTIMSELGMRLAAWDLRSIRASTGLDELDLEDLIAHPTLLIIELRESELEMLRPMANVIVVEILRYLTKRAESLPGQTLPRPVSIVIDEFASAIGRLPDIHVKLNTLRSRNVSIVAAIQSIAQIKANYERDADSVLAGFSTKILMPTLDFQDAEWASKESGTMTVRFNVASAGKNKRMIDYFATRNDNIQEQVQQRPVLTPDEISRPSDNAATFFMPNTPVFQGHLIPYYEIPEVSARFDAGKGTDFRLREAAIEYEESAPEVVEPVAAQAAAATQTPAQLEAALEELKAALRLQEADSAAQQWWKALEDLNKGNPQAVVNLGQQLFRRGVTIGEFYHIYASSGVDNIDQLLSVIDQQLMNQLKMTLGWESANQHAKEWWIAFEQANRDSALVIIELLQELQKRSVTIEDFFSAYVHSDCSSVPELLKVLDILIEEGKLKAKAKQEAAKILAQEQAIEATNGGVYSNGYPNGHSVEPVEQSYDPIGVEPDEIEPAAAEPEEIEPTLASKITTEVIPQTTSSETVYVSSKQLQRDAAITVYVKSYFEMGYELISQGKTQDFEKLVNLAREDSQFPDEYLPELESMRK